MHQSHKKFKSVREKNLIILIPAPLRAIAQCTLDGCAPGARVRLPGGTPSNYPTNSICLAKSRVLLYGDQKVLILDMSYIFFGKKLIYKKKWRVCHYNDMNYFTVIFLRLNVVNSVYVFKKIDKYLDSIKQHWGLWLVKILRYFYSAKI